MDRFWGGSQLTFIDPYIQGISLYILLTKWLVNNSLQRFLFVRLITMSKFCVTNKTANTDDKTSFIWISNVMYRRVWCFVYWWCYDNAVRDKLISWRKWLVLNGVYERVRNYVSICP
jgi:hypothetical protein